MNTKEVLAEFILSRRADGVSEKTIRWYSSLLAAFAEQYPTIDVSTHELRLYVVGLRKRLSEASVNGHITALHAFFAWAAREYDQDNPMKGIKRPKMGAMEPKAINPSDFVKLLQHANTRDAAILCFFADTGCRLAGVVGLKLVDLDIEQRFAIVWEKGNKSRKVFFTSFTAQILRRWLNARVSDSEYVFTSSSTGAGLTDSGIEQMLKRLKKRAGVRGRVNPHAFRHHFARQYVLNGGDVVTLARLLGHEDVTTTAAYYAVFTNDELAQLHGRYTPMNRLRDT